MNNGQIQPCYVYINVTIFALPSIDTVNLKFTSDLYLNLRWYDPRLQFMNLNNATTLNSLSSEDKKYIWTPRLVFVNALGRNLQVMQKCF